jgi:nucleotide-binding universal stress UspA family protein
MTKNNMDIIKTALERLKNVDIPADAKILFVNALSAAPSAEHAERLADLIVAWDDANKEQQEQFEAELKAIHEKYAPQLKAAGDAFDAEMAEIEAKLKAAEDERNNA